MAKKTAKAGDFIEITARKVSDKVQPEIKVGGIYHVNRVEQLKSGATVLVIDKDRKKNKTVRCNAERFTWEVRTPAEVQEKQFKEQCNADTKALMESFTFEEHVQIAFVPLIIAQVAWVYADKVVRYCADKVVRYCADKRISEVKKLSRTVKQLREHYLVQLSKDLDREHLNKILSQADELINVCAFDFQILYYSTCNEINRQHLKIEYDEMRTYAFLSMMFCREVRKHENRMTAMIAQKLGEAREGHLPCIDELYTCMDAYLGNNEIKITPVIETAMIKFQKNLSKIEFNLV